MTEEKQQFLTEKARQVRNLALDGIYAAQSGHPGGSFSAADIITYLYFDKLNVDPQNPTMDSRDRFVLSKGHCCPALYAALAMRGFFDVSEMQSLRKLGALLQGHPDMKTIPGIDMSTGSLGQGVSAACGIAKELKRKGKHLMAYSGYTFEQLLELSDPFVKKLLGQLDLLVDGPFIMAEKNIELRFRGSANQRVLDVPKSLEANEAVWAEQYR